MVVLNHVAAIGHNASICIGHRLCHIMLYDTLSNLFNLSNFYSTIMQLYHNPLVYVRLRSYHHSSMYYIIASIVLLLDQNAPSLPHTSRVTTCNYHLSKTNINEYICIITYFHQVGQQIRVHFLIIYFTYIIDYICQMCIIYIM